MMLWEPEGARAQHMQGRRVHCSPTSCSISECLILQSRSTDASKTHGVKVLAVEYQEREVRLLIAYKLSTAALNSLKNERR